MNIQIWMEGFAVTGQNGIAQMIWEGEANDFDSAISKYNLEKMGNMMASKGKLLDGKTMQPTNDYTIWGCRLFDNEKDARKSFG